jgi:hypothetical protein
MKTLGGFYVEIHVLLNSAQLEVSGQLHASTALPLGKEPTVSMGSGLCGPVLNYT